MSYRLSSLHALEILDSRARPTLEVAVELESGASARAGVPSGASTGEREAVELRDGDAKRYNGQGVTKAVESVNGEIASAIVGKDWASLADVDRALIELDGTSSKSRLGGNAIVGTSMALARAMAKGDRVPLYEFLAPEGAEKRLPVPHFNVINGGAHAQNPLDFQEFMIAPVGASSFAESLRAGVEIYAALKKRLHAAGQNTGLGDEGGFAPEIATAEDVLETIVAAIDDAGYEASREGVAIALDPAASELAENGSYLVAGETLTSDELTARYEQMVERFPIWSIEDGLGENDWDGWAALTERLGNRIQLVGDDLFVTNPGIVRDAIDRSISNAVLIKLNQVGTVTETLETIQLCRDAGWGAMISHRSGETSDPFIADLVVATGTGQIKTGAPARGERVSKYNRLVRIEHELGDAPYGLPAAQSAVAAGRS